MEENTLKDFLKNLGSRTPVPGGGAVSALNAAIASAQLKMVCEYTKDEGIKGKTSLLAQKSDAFLKLAEADADAFSKVSEAYKSNDERQIDLALVSALEVSARIITGCEDIVLLCENNYQDFNKRLSADVITALANLCAAVSSSQAMEKVNLNAIKGEKPKNLQEIVQYADGVLDRINKLIKKIEV